MQDYFRQFSNILFDKGYKPIPIRPKSKKPFMSKGESWKTEITKEKILEWNSNGKGHGGVGITGIGAIDFDISNQEVSTFMINSLPALVGSLNYLPIRFGEKPKFLIPVSAKSVIPQKWKNTWYDQEGTKQEIEFLSPKDQYFVVFGIHPDTGKEYTWHHDRSILDVNADSLKILDDLDFAMLEDTYNEIAERKGWTKKNKKVQKDSEDSFGSMKTSGQRNNSEGITELKTWLDLLPDHICDDRDEWVKIGAAIHHETDGSQKGFELFNAWSKHSKKYKGHLDTYARWKSYHKDQGIKNGSNCVTAGTIINKLKESGKWEKACKVITDKETKNIVELLNKRHAVINLGGKCKILNEDKEDITFSSVADFHSFYSNQLAVDLKNPKKKISYSKIWMSSKNRKQYNGIIFNPNLEVNKETNQYNLWKGLALQPAKGSWDLFRDHIYTIIANSDEIISEWLLAWIARIIQKPGGDRPGTSIVLRGKQGTGKGIFVNTIGEFFGDHFLQVANPIQVTGRFNSHLKAKLLVFVDEGFWAGDRKAEGVIKNIITEPYITIESKGFDIIRVRNYINLILASNSDWVVPAGLEERRFFVLDIAESRQQDKKYFNKIVKQMNSGGKEAMLYDLLKMDISKIDLRTFDQTQGLFEQKLFSMSIAQKYWFESLKRGSLIDSDSYDTLTWGFVESKKQYNDYLNFSQKLREKFPLSPTAFGMSIQKLCPILIKKRLGTGIKRKYGKLFPDIDQCRSVFEKQLKMEINWDSMKSYDDELPF